MSKGKWEPEYRAWRRVWRRRASRSQSVLAWAALAVAFGVVSLHWFLVASPQRQVDLAQLDLPYLPWYIAQQPTVATREVGAGLVSGTAAQATPGLPSAGPKQFLLRRPNLVPQPEDWDPEKLKEAVLAHLSQEAQATGRKPNEPDAEAGAVAQALAERYAAEGAGAVQGEYERSLLAGGWLWDAWRGCETVAYLSFPGESIKGMGCMPDVFPSGAKTGLGVARWGGPLGESAPVFAVVWRNAGVQGDTR